MARHSLGEWLTYLEQLHPKDIDLGLARIDKVARSLGLLPYPCTTVTVAGTNGKGSTVYTCDAVLRASGRRTGRYTSPHLLRYNERIAVNDRPVDDALIVTAFETIEAARGAVSLTYFEFATLAALWIFAREQVDVAILEVGLGGRLDAVNVVDASVAVVTSIDLDHQAWLGDTVEEIAPEKAAVARSAAPVVLAESSYPHSLGHSLAAIGARVLRAGESWSWRVAGGGLALRLPTGEEAVIEALPRGLRPANVAAGICAAACVLPRLPSDEALSAALEALAVPARREHRRFAGREFVLDVAHNPAAMEALAEHLRDRPGAGQTFAIFGVMADKALEPMVAALASEVAGACALEIPGLARAQTPERIWQALDRAGIAMVQSDFDADRLLAYLLAGTEVEDRIVVCGSFHSVAAVVEAMERYSPPQIDDSSRDLEFLAGGQHG